MKNHFTDNKELHTFFDYVSKAVIIIPIFVVVISLFFKFNQPKKQVNQTPTTIPTINIKKNNSFKFDLKGPITCDNLFIKNKNIYFKNEMTNYLLNGDCLYTWGVGKYNGQKKCGLSNYVGLVETYLGFMSVDDLINNDLIKDKIKNKDVDLASIIKSCKRTKIRDQSIFEIPKKILFSNK